MQQREITTRIRRDELEWLLDTTDPTDDQRITAEIPAVTLEELLDDETTNPSIDAVIDAAVDAAIDAAIHDAEIDAAIDAVMLPSLSDAMPKQHYGVIALSFALSFAAGIGIMVMLG